MHPPVLREVGSMCILVAGERRLRAIQELFELGGDFLCDGVRYADGVIPFLSLGDLTELEAEEAELDENLRRADLTWQEHAAAVARLHALRSGQKKELAPEDLPIPEHTYADTAEELTGNRQGYYQAVVRKEIIVAGHLDNPEVAKAKNVEEAFKVLKRQEAVRKNIEQSKVVGATFNANLHTLTHTDCITWMKDYADSVVGGSARGFDVILTDPPYGMGAQDFGDGGGKLTGIEHRYDDSYAVWITLMSDWTRLSYAVTAPQAHAYVFCDIDRFHELKGLMETAGWYVFRTPMISYKINSGRVPLPTRGPRRQYETLLYAIKGGKTVTHIYPDVIPNQGDANMAHGAQKSAELFQNLLQRSVAPGDMVLDTFAGSGAIFPAAHTMQCKATGLEFSEEYYAQSLARLTRLIQDEKELNF